MLLNKVILVVTGFYVVIGLARRKPSLDAYRKQAKRELRTSTGSTRVQALLDHKILAPSLL